MILEKRLNGLWWFYDAFYTDSFTPYPFGCIIDRSANTFVLTKENRPSYPKLPLPVAEVQIRVLPSTALETYTTAELLENRLLELEFPPLVVGAVPSSGISEAPVDGELYGRKDADWEIVSNLDIYSTSEIVVGTWIDEKPIYRTVIVLDSADYAAPFPFLITHNLNIKDYLLHDIVIPRTAASQEKSLRYNIADAVNNPASNYLLYFNIITSFLENSIESVASIYRNGDNTIFYLILEYTKTTD